MLTEHLTYTNGCAPLSGDGVYRFCAFENLDLDGLQFSGIMQGTTFTKCQFYWGHFNCALLDGVRFVNCTFPGTSLRGTRIVDCTFENCRFVLNNLGGDCTIDKCIVAACVFDGCGWIARPGGKRDITNSRFLGCTFRSCSGFEGLS